jgi:hypothetical protein
MCVDAIVSATNAPADPALVETLWRDFGCEGKGLTAEGFQQVQQDLSLLLVQKYLLYEYKRTDTDSRGVATGPLSY